MRRRLLQKWDRADKILDDLPASFIKDMVHSYNKEFSFTQTSLDEYLSFHQRLGKCPDISYGMDFDAKKCVGEIDDSLRKAAYIVPQTKDYEKAIKSLGIDKAISMDARNCEVLSPDRSRSRRDGFRDGVLNVKRDNFYGI